jgi:hypothetical protein
MHLMAPHRANGPSMCPLAQAAAAAVARMPGKEWAAEIRVAEARAYVEEAWARTASKVGKESGQFVVNWCACRLE